MTEQRARMLEFPRWWVQQIRDYLFSMGQLPPGKLGDWAFLFREKLNDALAAQSASPAATAMQDNLREAWSALAMIREAIETLAPSGSVKASEYLDGPTFMHEADALVAGIQAIASPAAQPVAWRETLENIASFNITPDTGYSVAQAMRRTAESALATPAPQAVREGLDPATIDGYPLPWKITDKEGGQRAGHYGYAIEILAVNDAVVARIPKPYANEKAALIVEAIRALAAVPRTDQPSTENKG